MFEVIVKIIRKPFISKKSYRREEVSSPLIDNSPYLTPWYIRENKPLLVKNNQLLSWEVIDKIKGVGLSLFKLKNQSNQLFGVVKMYNYIYPNTDNSKFLIWTRNIYINGPNPIIKIDYYDLEKLKPLTISQDELLIFNKSDKTYLFNGSPEASFKYIIDSSLSEDEFILPEEFKGFNSFLVIVDDKTLYDGDRSFNKTLILEFNPVLNTVKYFPQDWFNKSDSDFGYVWITRAIRGSDGFIHGQGIRMRDFILDSTGRQLRKEES